MEALSLSRYRFNMASKVVIVTGASRGIGLAVTEYLANHSHKVVIVSRSREALQELKDRFPSQIEYIAADLTNFEGYVKGHRIILASPVSPGTAGPSIQTRVKRRLANPRLGSVKVTELALKSYGRLDGLVVNHGVLAPMKRIADSTPEEWRKLYDANLFSALAFVRENPCPRSTGPGFNRPSLRVQAAIPHLRATKGRIVFTSSGAANHAYTSWGACGSSKAAMNSLAQHVAVEETDIITVAIGPGRVDTAMQKEIRDQGSSMTEKDHANFVAVFEEGKLNKPEWPRECDRKAIARCEARGERQVFEVRKQAAP